MKTRLALSILSGVLLLTPGIVRAQSNEADIKYPTKAGAIWEYKIIRSNKPRMYNMRAVLTNLPQRNINRIRVTPQRLVIQGGKSGTRIKSFFIAEDNSGLFGFAIEKRGEQGFLHTSIF